MNLPDIETMLLLISATEEISLMPVILAFIGLVNTLILYRQRQIDKRFENTDFEFKELYKIMTSLAKEIAELRVLFASFDRDEFGRHRHRITNLEIEQGKIKEELHGIKERCSMLHKSDK
jgi:hypothetical protein